jgi:hypothetical protein
MIAERVGPPGGHDTPPADLFGTYHEGRIPVRFAAAMLTIPAEEAYLGDGEDGEFEAVPPSPAAAPADEAGSAPRTARPPGDMVDSAVAEIATADALNTAAFPDTSDGVSAPPAPWSHALFAEYDLMEKLAAAAVAAADGEEAAHLVAAIAPLSLRLVRDGSPLWPALPGLIQAAARVTRRLYERPAARPLIALTPVMLRRMIMHLAQSAATGQTLSPRLAARIFNQHAAAVLNQRTGTADAAHAPRVVHPARRPAAAYEMDYQD